MIEKIGTKGYETISKPAFEILTLLETMKKNDQPLMVAEIGIGIGATSVKILELLNESDTLYLFDYQEKVKELLTDLKSINTKDVSIIGVGNSRKTYDSYCWNLAKILLERKQSKRDIPLFNLVYLDGAHTFLHDSSTCCVVKALVKKGGFLIFDDMNWSFVRSPTLNPSVKPEISNHYSEEQLNTCQISMVVDTFMRGDINWEQLFLDDNHNPNKAIFMKLK